MVQYGGNTGSAGSSKIMLLHAKLEEIASKIDELHREVSYKYETSQPAVYEEFFPNGKTPFRRMRRGQVEAMVRSLLTVGNAHIDEQIEPTLVQLEALLTEYLSLEDGQKDAKQDVKDSSHDETHLREELTRALFKGLIKLMNLHFDDLGLIKTLYDAKYLNFYKKPKPKPESAPEA